MSTALKRQVYGRGRGDPVPVKRAADDLRAVYFRDLVLLRSADMGSLAFVVFWILRASLPQFEI